MATNLLSYVSYDFDDLVIQLQDRLKETDAWKDVYRSSTGEMLIELLAYVLNLCMYYAERRAEESYLNTAQNRSSVVNLVSLLNYQPKRVTSSIGTLQFSIAASQDTIVYIPKYTECESVDGVKFLTNESGAIQKGQTSVSVSGIQGELVQTEVTSNGALNQEYAIDSTEVENSEDTDNPTLRVIVDGEEWSPVASFLYSESTSLHYRIINEMDGTVSVLFGDNINGKSPASGEVVLIQYITSAGSDGNVTYTDRITTINDAIYDSEGDGVTVTVTNTSAFLGGDAEESIEEIRVEAPQVFQTGDRAVTREDFISILSNLSGVADTNVWGENEEAEAAGVSADVTMLNMVRIALVLQEWQLADATFKANVSDELYEKSMMTVKYEFIDPVFLQVIPVLTVLVVTGESLSQTQADIEEELDDQFLLGSTTKLGTIIKYSNVLSALDDLDGVSYMTMDLEIYKALSATYSSVTDWGATLDAVDVLPESARLFIDGTYVTSDVDNEDGTGTFSSAGGYTISGTINYSTGVTEIDISPAASTVHIRYQQDEDRNIVPTFRQICKLNSVDIASIQMES
jgi:hypothetical protein